MKKILSLAMAVIMLVSAVPMVYAAETTDVSNGTTITATGTKGAAYSVTVPAVLTPGQSGTVTASGTWAANQTLKVTALTSVDLVNGSDKIPVGIEFAGIEEVGNNNGDAEYATATVTVGNVDTSAFFGTWTGTLNYTVEMVTEAAAQIISFTVNGNTYQAEAGMTWREWIESDYNTSEKPSEITIYEGYPDNVGNAIQCGDWILEPIVRKNDVIIANTDYATIF